MRIGGPSFAGAARILVDELGNLPYTPGKFGGLLGRPFIFARILNHAQTLTERYMANTSSAKKATRKIAARTEVNKARRSRVRTFLRKVEEAIATGNKVVAAAALLAAQPELMRAATKGVMHKSTASRKVSRLSLRVNKLTA